MLSSRNVEIESSNQEPLTAESVVKRLVGFPPVADPSATVLILGSMPGERSLVAGQYYAHPRNAFWPIMTRLIGLHPDDSYPVRLAALKGAGIALWDVLRSCEREGSLDIRIASESMETNDFQGFFRHHPDIQRVYFNGAASEKYFRKHVLPGLSLAGLEFCRLPSTSPACAISFDKKLDAWQRVTTISPESPNRIH